MTTMLSIIQQATAEMGVAVPTFAAGNTAQDTIQQLALLNACGYELYRQYQWEGATQEYRFFTEYLTTTGNLVAGSSVITNLASTNISNTTYAPGITAVGNAGLNQAVITSAGNTTTLDSTYQVLGTGVLQDVYVVSLDSSTQVTMSQPANATGTGVSITFSKVKYAYPSDFDRLIDRTDWDKSKHWEMSGPETAQQWQWLKSGYISTGPRIRFRPVGGYFQIWPAVSTNDLLGFEYLSKNWAFDLNGAGKTSLTVDTDTTIFPDRLLVLGLKAKYWQVKGFGDIYMADYIRELDLAKSHDAGSPLLSMAPRPGSTLITWNNIPDSNYGA